MLKTLIKLRLLSLSQSFVGRRRVRSNTGTVKKVLYALLALYVIACIFFVITMLFLGLAKPLIALGIGWLVMGLAALLCIAFSFIGSIFMTQQQIYAAKDNELLLSMPIPPSYILASRIILILVLNLFFGVLFLIPAFIVYCINLPAVSVSMIIIFILAFILVAFFSTALSCICGWLIAMITSRLRRKNLFNTILMLAFLFGYLYFYMNLQSYTQKLIAAGSAFADAMSRAFPPAYLFGAAIDGTDFFALLQFALWCLIPFAVVYSLLSKSFIKIATTNRGGVRVKYREKPLSVSSVRSALLKKELGRFFSLPMYILNCSLGAIFALIAAGALIVKGPALLGTIIAIPGFGGDKIPLLLCALMCFLASTNDITAPSISLEAKTLWILKSIPIRPSDVFYSKIMASLIITVPPLVIASITAGVVLSLPLLQSVLIVVLPIVFQVLISLFGLVMNLLLPRFDWLNETVAIKQSASVIAAIFGGYAIIVIPTVVYLFLASNVPADIYLVLCTIFFAVLSGMMLMFLKTRGSDIFNEL